ncbi:unannotated protein [freshwater metagenome]|uniref:Unannotated protein n=1 Tax=freshwater metagenome TaxID=449393 RepID=A0A6J7IQ10_9ZZZZ
MMGSARVIIASASPRSRAAASATSMPTAAGTTADSSSDSAIGQSFSTP